MARLFIVGGGLAGLSAAVEATQHTACWSSITVLEAAPAPGGRCRSIEAPDLGIKIDNGNHLALGSNVALLSYLKQLNAGDRLIAPRQPIDIVDLQSDERKRAPASLAGLILSSARDRQFGLRRLARLGYGVLSRRERALADCIGDESAGLAGLILTSVFNTRWQDIPVGLLASILAELIKHPSPLEAYIPKDDLSHTFVEPATVMLEKNDVQVLTGTRVRALETSADGRVTRLGIRGESIDLDGSDQVILALPAAAALALTDPRNAAPPGSAILNIHFRIDEPAIEPMLNRRVLAALNASFEWAFFRPGVTSTTVSAWNDDRQMPLASIAKQQWRDLQMIEGNTKSGLEMPPFKAVVERSATPLQDVAYQRMRMALPLHRSNLHLAGDWTVRTLPATMEAAVRSGKLGAASALNAASCWTSGRCPT